MTNSKFLCVNLQIVVFNKKNIFWKYEKLNADRQQKLQKMIIPTLFCSERRLLSRPKVQQIPLGENMIIIML